MKKNLLTAVLVISCAYVYAQDEYKGALKFNPVSLLVKTSNVSLEKRTRPNQSIQLGIFYSAVGFEDFSYAGYGITPEYRVYFGGQKRALNGGYVAPFVRYQDLKIGDKNETKAKFFTIGGGAVFGWEKPFKSGLLLDFFAGPSYNELRFRWGSEKDYDLKAGLKGFGLRSGVTVGFTF